MQANTPSIVAEGPISIVGPVSVYYPADGTNAADAPAEFRLKGVDEPMGLAPLYTAPFDTYLEEAWRAIAVGTDPARAADLALGRALWVVESVIEQWQRSTQRGLPYLTRTEAGCPAPVPMPEKGPPPIACPPAPAPALQCFGWMYPLRSDPGGAVRIRQRRYRPTSPMRVARWWASYTQLVTAALEPYSTQVASPSEMATSAPDSGALRQRIRDMPTATLHEEARLKITWRASRNTFCFEMPYHPYCLEDSAGKVYKFSEGVIQVTATAHELSRFIDAPPEARLQVRVRAAHPDARNPFVATDGSLCDAGQFRGTIARDKNLSPGGMILSALQAGIRIIMTGGGDVSHTPFRSLDESGAPVISAEMAERLGIPLIRWRHGQRGMEAVRIG